MRASILLLILSSVTLSALAQMLLKIGVGRAASAAVPNPGLAAMLTTPMVLFGLLVYGVGAILWLFVLGKVPLSVAYPFVGAGFILTAFIGVAILDEAFSWARLFGTLMIAVGCVIVARSA